MKQYLKVADTPWPARRLLAWWTVGNPPTNQEHRPSLSVVRSVAGVVEPFSRRWLCQSPRDPPWPDERRTRDRTAAWPPLEWIEQDTQTGQRRAERVVF